MDTPPTHESDDWSTSGSNTSNTAALGTPVPDPEPPQPLNFWTKFAFGAGDLGPAVTANVMVFFLMFFFTEAAGMPSALAGRVLMVGKISDALNDPLIGVFSDRTRSKRWGRRYPWILWGGIPFGVFFFLQWLVPTQNLTGLFFYYLAIAICFNLAYTAVNLPYTALTPDLTEDYNERTSLNSFRFAFSIGGSILSLVLAQVIFSLVDDIQQRYWILGLLCTLISVPPLYLCVWGTYRRAMAAERRSAAAPPPATIPLRQQWAIALSNRPFLYVIGIYLSSWLAVQLTASLLPYFVTSYMGLPESVFPTVALAIQGTALTLLFVWSRLSAKLGKKVVYCLGTGIWVIAMIGMVLVQPGQTGLLYAIAILAGFGVSTAYLIPWSMLPDTIDLDELNTGQRREGVFYAFMVFLQKMGLALGLWLAGEMLGWAGYIERVPGEAIPVQPASAITAIHLAVSALPIVFLALGIWLTSRYPISREVHAEILLKLDAQRRSRAPALEPNSDR